MSNPYAEQPTQQAAPAKHFSTVEIGKIHPLQAGKVIGALYAAMTLIFVPFLVLGGIAGTFAPNQGENLPPVVFVILAVLMPIFYGVMGFIFGAISAAIYNLIANAIGGLRIDVK